MKKLNQHDIEFLVKTLQDGGEIPPDYKYALFPAAQKEYELAYARKMRKADLLANEDGVFPVPLQVEKVFNGKDHEEFKDGWKNMIVFGDNLQFLKTIYENKDPFIKGRIKGKVKLIYIDPPFATTDEFQNKEGVKAYTDKKKGAEFVEFLRRRLILAREILADDGSIFVHLDQKMSHYIKVLMDEVFGKNQFRNEIVWFYPSGGDKTTYFQRKHDVIYFYSKTNDYYFNQASATNPYTEKQLARFKHVDKETGKKFYWNSNPRGERVKTFIKDGIIDYDVWNIGIDASKNKYPTQKPEKLFKKIIESTTQEGDIVFDFFGGSGRTAEVSEKLGRKWITCDLGKLSYFTMQKRILCIQKSKDLGDTDKKYNKKAKNFVTAQLGIYDLKKALDLEWQNYQTFVAGLFEIEVKENKISGFIFDGKKNGVPVKIFNYGKFKNSEIDENYLEKMHAIIGKRVGGRVYIVAPANYINFITDYHELDRTKYYFLKIPYHVIKELHKTPFQKLRQPQSKKDVNNLEEAIGFHFIRPPEVKSALKQNKSTVKILIKSFVSHKFDAGVTQNKADGFETLSAVFVDKSYNGKSFEMDEVFFADELLPENKKNEKVTGTGVEIPLQKSEIGKRIMVVYTDIYGNDFTEILEVK